MKQIRVGWNQRIDVLRSCCEWNVLLSGEWANTFFKAIRVIIILKGPKKILEIARNSPSQMKIELSMLKEKWAQDFDELSGVSGDKIEY